MLSSRSMALALNGIIVTAANDVPHTITISRAALVARIERTLAKQGRKLRSCQPLPLSQRKYLVIDTQQHVIVATYTDLVQLGRDLHCLEPWERLAVVSTVTPPDAGRDPSVPTGRHRRH
jgi:hypothetical protein